MKATEVYKLAEMIATFKTKKEDKPMRSRRGPPRHLNRMNDESITTLLQRKLEEADTLRKMLEDREKANKKDDKKDDKKSTISTEQLAIFLVLTYPIVGLLLYQIVGK